MHTLKMTRMRDWVVKLMTSRFCRLGRAVANGVPAAPVQYSQVRATDPEICIDLALGQPGDRLLPLNMMREAAHDRFKETNPTFLQYGVASGYSSFREELAQFLKTRTEKPVDPRSLFITNGASGGLSLLTTVLTNPGDSVIVEDPTYFLALKVLQDHNVKVESIPMTPTGIDLDMLESKLKSGSLKPKLLYTIPVYQNPTGVTIPHSNRVRLAFLANQYEFTVVADEVYQMLSFPSVPTPSLPPPMFYYNDNSYLRSHLVSMGSFSKIIAPGLRLGWIQAPDWVLTKLGANGEILSGGNQNPVIAGLVHSAIHMGLEDKHLDMVRAELAKCCTVLCDGLRKHLPKGCEFITPSGGYFVWVKLPDGLTGDHLLQIAVPEYRVKFLAGSRAGPSMEQYIRLSFSYYEPDVLEQGAVRLGEAIHRCITPRV